MNRTELAARLHRHDPTPGLLDDVAALTAESDRTISSLREQLAELRGLFGEDEIEHRIIARHADAAASAAVAPKRPAPRRAPARGQRRTGTGKAAT